MRLLILGMGSVFGAGVLAAMFLAIWSTRPAVECALALGQNFASKLVWAAIPFLMILAAATAALLAIASAGAGS